MTVQPPAVGNAVIAWRETKAIQRRIAAGELTPAEGLRMFMETGSDCFGALECVCEALGGGDRIIHNAQGVPVFAHSGVSVAQVEAILEGLHIEEPEELPARAA